MLTPRYKIRVRTTDGIEEYPARTKKEAEDTFTLLMGWDNAQNGKYVGYPENRLYIELQDAGKERGEFQAIQWAFLNDDLEKAAKSGERDLLDRTLKRLTQKEGGGVSPDENGGRTASQPGGTPQEGASDD